MSRLKKTILMVILVFLVFVTAILLNGCSENWVEVVGTGDYTIYYKPSSVIINKRNKTIKVLTKHIYTEKGLNNAINYFGHATAEKDFYNNFGYALNLFLLTYKDWKYSIIHKTGYSKSGDVLFDKEYPVKWENLDSYSIGLILINKIIKEYNIQM
jgi:hypothetical protein